MPGTRTNFTHVDNEILVAICKDSFKVELPDIDSATWASILDWDGPAQRKNERLEFLGDAVLYLCLATELYERDGCSTPGHMTHIRQPLASNLVLALIAEKADPMAVHPHGSILGELTRLCRLRSSGQQAKTDLSKSHIKHIADRLESAIGALFIERGLGAVRRWISKTFSTLIAVAANSRKTSRHLEMAGSSKRPWQELDLPNEGSSKKRKHAYETSSKRDRGATRVVGHSRERETVAEIIDLTGDDFEDKDGERIDFRREEDAEHLIIDLTLDDDEIEQSMSDTSADRLTE